MSANYVTVSKFSELTGITEKAVRRKIEAGKWLAGEHFRKSPDGRLFISMEGYNRWVEQGQASRPGRQASGSSSQRTAEPTLSD